MMLFPLEMFDLVGAGVLCVAGKMTRYGIASDISSLKSYVLDTADMYLKGTYYAK